MPYIYGQLISAQLENSVGAPASGGTPLGRVYLDITSTSAAVPMYHNGSNWMAIGASLMTPNTTATVSFNTVGNHEVVYNTSASTISALTINLPTTTTIGQVLTYITNGVITSLTVSGGTVSLGTTPTGITLTLASVTVAIPYRMVTYRAINTTGTFIRTA